MDEQKILNIRKERKELSEKILKLKSEILNLQPGVPDVKSKNEMEYCRLRSILLGLASALAATIGILISIASKSFWGLISIPPIAVGVAGVVVNENEIKKLNKNKKKQSKKEINSELMLKEEELEKLEAYDHDLYTQLIQELSKSEDGTVKNYEKYRLIDNKSWTFDEYEDIKEV